MLMRAAAIVRDSVREIDVAARYGGEEFAVLLPDTSRLGAFVVAERIRRRRSRSASRAPGRRSRSRAASRSSPTTPGAPADLIVQADAGLYGAKAAGKNRILLPQGERRRFRRLPRPAARHPRDGRTRAAGQRQEPLRGRPAREPAPGGRGGQRGEPHHRAHGRGARSDLRGEVVRVERVPGEAEPAFDVGVRFVDPAEAEALLRHPEGGSKPAPDGYLST